MEGRHEELEPLDRAYDLSSLGGEVEAVARGDRSMQQCHPWYRRVQVAGLAHLDLQDPDQLDLLGQYGPFSTDLRIWVEGDPLPVVQATETLDGLPRVTYRLDPEELDRLQANLDKAGLVDVSLRSRRSRTEVRS